MVDSSALHFRSSITPVSGRGKSLESTENAQGELALLGARIRFARLEKGLTLAQLSKLVNRAPSLLSQIENGKREPKISLLHAIARAVGVSVEELMKSQPPSEQAALELKLKSLQNSKIAKTLRIPQVYVGPRLPADALKALVNLYQQLQEATGRRNQTPEAAREANLALRADMHAANNYIPEIEELAGEITRAVGHQGGPLLTSGVEEIAHYLGFSIEMVADLPSAARSVTDLRQRRIYLPRAARGDKDPRMVILRALGDQALNHQVPNSFEEFLVQRVRSNYFAAAVLMPQTPTVEFLLQAKAQRDLAICDLRDLAAVRYETAAHRLTNLATTHLGLRMHFLRVGEDGVIYKAYTNDAVIFPTDAFGSIEGQLACRHFGARRVFQSSDPYTAHYQYTDTPQGTYWSVSQVEKYGAGNFAISVGVSFQDAAYFRGRETTNRWESTCPDPGCCRLPEAVLAQRWAPFAWPSVRAHSHLLAAVPPGSFPGLDDREVYEFLESHSG